MPRHILIGNPQYYGAMRVAYPSCLRPYHFARLLGGGKVVIEILQLGILH